MSSFSRTMLSLHTEAILARSTSCLDRHLRQRPRGMALKTLAQIQASQGSGLNVHNSSVLSIIIQWEDSGYSMTAGSEWVVR